MLAGAVKNGIGSDHIINHIALRDFLGAELRRGAQVLAVVVTCRRRGQEERRREEGSEEEPVEGRRREEEWVRLGQTKSSLLNDCLLCVEGKLTERGDSKRQWEKTKRKNKAKLRSLSLSLSVSFLSNY